MEASSCPKCEFVVEPGWTECLRCGVVFAKFRGHGDVFDARRVPPAGVTARPHEGDEVLADRSARLGAQVVDFLSLLPFAFAMAVPAGLVRGQVATEVKAGAAVAMLFGLVGFIALLIYNLVLLHRHGQTLGKRVCNVRIVRTSGERVSLGRLILLRGIVPGLVTYLPLVGVYLSVAGYLLILTPSRRCLHDYCADTKVVVA
ncbi:MAG TPA: RDD family protein [Thermoanaerobaculia bacterium]|nr:RDD family protein [Thermoanaerobaculia bacterium]